MPFPEIEYQWEWDLESSPEDLWPIVSDTNRFDRDSGVPALKALESGKRLVNARHQFRQLVFGLPLDYVREPYEWVYPYHYGVVRHYKRGPLLKLNVQVKFEPREGGGTRCIYWVGATARNLPGFVGIPIMIGVMYARRFEKIMRSYDRMVASGKSLQAKSSLVEFASGGRARLATLRQRLIDEDSNPELVDRLVQVIETRDPLALSRIRPYELADSWGVSRRSVLELCLLATRAGLLEFQWDLLCPLCRNARASSQALGGVRSNVHCDTCNIDFTVNFDRSVELTFCPNPAIRPVDRNAYCIGGPVDTPHVIVQQLLAPATTRQISTLMEPGRYRVRVLEQTGGQFFRVESGAPDANVSFLASTEGWPDLEPVVPASPKITLENQTNDEQLFILERMAWTDQAATAAEVIVLQRFRDLFANEALRPGEQISVGSMAIMFTDLRESTRMYYEIGDAPAFGIVMNHFDVLRTAIAAEQGSIVKTIGDSVMAVFPAPAAALRAILNAQSTLNVVEPGSVALLLKAGIHYGPCIAVTLNDRLDYFGSTVNIAARLEGQSSGQDVIISEMVFNDPEVVALLDGSEQGLSAQRIETTLKGFGEQRFGLWRVAMNQPEFQESDKG
jgi:class 3 adenylate cyclase